MRNDQREKGLAAELFRYRIRAQKEAARVRAGAVVSRWLWLTPAGRWRSLRLRRLRRNEEPPEGFTVTHDDELEGDLYDSFRCCIGNLADLGNERGSFVIIYGDTTRIVAFGR